ncbi:MAG: hypothetical protein GYA71_01105 [Bacteroidales bacterium]|nr:hypothetical protein [Bacteroidales bacterium]
MVEVVRGIYPKYDKTMQSKCERGDEYGVQLRPDGMKALLEKFAPERLAKKGDGHRLTCRISCRLEDDEYADLLHYVKIDGFDTMQAWLTYMVRRYIKRRRSAERKELFYDGTDKPID